MNMLQQSGRTWSARALAMLMRSIAWAFGHLILATLCLVHWRAADHWSSFDGFSVTYLVFKLVGSIQSLHSGMSAFRSEAIRREWWGMSSDPNIVRWTQLLMMGDLLIFYDYAHWHTLQWLALPAIRLPGLALYVLAKLWQMWTDSYLAAYFADHESAQQPVVMSGGPFRFIRHPRYAAVMLGKISCALIFASIFGWILAVAWAFVYTRKVMREENYLRESLGQGYREYSAKTARLIPGVY
jgi:protein-S-isoprenylcysteine O-methyltransferase Ste14